MRFSTAILVGAGGLMVAPSFAQSSAISRLDSGRAELITPLMAEPAGDGIAAARVVSWADMLDREKESASNTEPDSGGMTQIHHPFAGGEVERVDEPLGVFRFDPTAGDVPATVPRIGIHFPGANLAWTRLHPPDTMGAIGPGHFVEMINGSVAVYDRRSGLRMSRVSLRAFFDVFPGFKFDPRILFDASVGRWIAVAASSPGNTPDPFGLCLAVSQTGDPLGEWFQLFFHDPLNPTSLHDFPILGVGPNGIYVGVQLFPPAANRVLWAFEKAPLTGAGQRLGAVNLWRYENSDPLPVPVQSLGALGADLVVGVQMPEGRFHIHSVEGSAASPMLRPLGVVQGPPASLGPRTAPVPGETRPTSLDAGTYITSAPVYRNRAIWVALRIDANSRNAVHWARLSPFSVPPRVVDADTIAHPSMHYFFPSLSVNADGDMVMAFNGSDGETFVGAYCSGRRGSDPIGASAPVTLLKAGEAVFGTSAAVTRRWGDYSATSVDPLDDRTFWTIQQYAGFQGQADTWGLWIAALSFRVNDCNGNSREDACDIDCAAGGCGPICGTSDDCQGNGVPDECEPQSDCNQNGLVDSCEVALGQAADCNQNGQPDECDPSHDCNANGIPDECETDCNANGVPDDCDLASGGSGDCNDNLIPDECESRPNSLVSSDPMDRRSLSRSARNSILLEFQCELLVPPLPGRDLVVSELLPGGAFGGDLSGGFEVVMEDRHAVRLVDRLGRLEPGRWYSISSGNWVGMQRFDRQYPVLVGDVDGNGRVLSSDLARVNVMVPTYPADPWDRRDVNADGAILHSDLSMVLSRIPAKVATRPEGHGG